MPSQSDYVAISNEPPSAGSKILIVRAQLANTAGVLHHEVRYNQTASKFEITTSQHTASADSFGDRIAFYHREYPSLPILVLDGLSGTSDYEDGSNGFGKRNVIEVDGSNNLRFQIRLRFLLCNSEGLRKGDHRASIIIRGTIGKTKPFEDNEPLFSSLDVRGLGSTGPLDYQIVTAATPLKSLSIPDDIGAQYNGNAPPPIFCIWNADDEKGQDAAMLAHRLLADHDYMTAPKDIVQHPGTILTNVGNDLWAQNLSANTSLQEVRQFLGAGHIPRDVARRELYAMARVDAAFMSIRRQLVQDRLHTYSLRFERSIALDRRKMTKSAPRIHVTEHDIMMAPQDHTQRELALLRYVQEQDTGCAHTATSEQSTHTWKLGVEGIHPEFIRRFWNERILPAALKSARIADGGHTLSALPQFDSPWIGDDAAADLFQRDRGWGVHFIFNDLDRADAEPDFATKRYSHTQRLTLAEIRPVRRWADAEKSEGSYFIKRIKTNAVWHDISFPGVLTQGGTPLRLKSHIPRFFYAASVQARAFDLDANWNVKNRLRGLGLVLEVPKSGPASIVRVRLGSLDLGILEAAPTSYDPKEVDAWTVFAGSAADVSPQHSQLSSRIVERSGSAVYANVILPLADIDPATQDITPQELQDEIELADSQAHTTQKTHVISLQSAGKIANPVALAALKIEERALSIADRSIDMKIESKIDSANAATAETQSKSYFVFGAAPFFIGRIGKISGLWSGDDTSNQIATWLSAERRWRFSIPNKFILRLPSQGIGEQVERRREDQADLKEWNSADFRLTPAASLDLELDEFDRAFVEAPWNLDWVFGFPGQRAPGARLSRLEAEFLYGLSVNVQGQSVRVAFIDARVGALAPISVEGAGSTSSFSKLLENFGVKEDLRTTFNTAVDELKEGWLQDRLHFRSRLGVLELKSEGVPGELLLKDGVNYTLRNSADLAYPIPSAWQNDELEGKSLAPRPTDGLPGGVSYGFESANIYESVWRNPQSTQAQIAGVYLSALGGWAKQKASFDNNRSVIYGDVAMGRTYFYKLERIGRIGVFWNRAKHVIIYERTAHPARQFIAENPNDGTLQFQQDLHLGRPVVRKVREYVQIFQTSRAYPDFGDSASSQRAVGFVKRCEFKSVEIAVDSAWGEDIRDEGWRVPLWRPGEDKGAYPKPHILLEVDTDPEVGAPSQVVELDAPQNIYFFTSTRPELDDNTDSWPAVRDIDFPDLPPPAPSAIEDGLSAADPDASMPAAEAVVPGYETFTFPLAIGVNKTNLAAQRAQKPLSAMLRNVSMARSKASTISTDATAVIPEAFKQIKKLAEQRSVVSDAYGALVEEVRKLQLASGTRKVTDATALVKRAIDNVHFDKKLQEYKVAAEKLNGATDPKTVSFICESLKQAATTLAQNAQSQFEARFKQTDAAIEQAIQMVQASTSDLAEFKKRLARDIDDCVLRLTLTPTIAGSPVAQLQNRLKDVTHLLVQEKKRIVGVLNLSGTLFETEATKGLQSGQWAIGRFEQTLFAEITYIRDRVSRILATAMPALLGLDNKTGIAAEIQSNTDAVAILLSAARDKLGTTKTDIDNVSAELNGVTAKVEGLFVKLTALVDNAQTRVDAGWKEVEKQIEIALTYLRETLHGTLNNIINAAPNAADCVSHLRQEWTSSKVKIRDNIKIVGENGVTEIDKLCDIIDTNWASRINGVTELLDSGTKLFEAANGLVANTLEELTAKLDGIAANIQNRVDSVVGAMTQSVQEKLAAQLNNYGGGLNQAADQGLRLLRAFGETPEVPNLDFNRERLAYYFDQQVNNIKTTATAALMDRANQELKALGTRMPTREMLDQAILDLRKKFDLSKALPDFAGINLSELLQDVPLPDLTPDQMQVKHGIDKQSRTAWLETKTDFELPGEPELLSFGPLSLKLIEPHLFAQSRSTLSAAGSTDNKVDGFIRGDWQLNVGGFNVVTFVDTPLTFADDDGVRFEIAPEKVQMDDGLAFLSDLMSKLETKDNASGLSINLIRENGLPVGAESVLNIPVPDFGAGAFAISNVLFHAAMELRALPDFSIGVTFALSKQTAPFNLTIFILGGGGWVTCAARYFPLQRRMTTSVDIGITASAALLLNAGAIQGGIAIYLGVFGQYYTDGQGGGSLDVGIMLLIAGHASLKGLVTVSVSLMLQAKYGQGGSLTGTGTMRYSVRISRFFKIEVSERVTYVFASGGGGSAGASGGNQREKYRRSRE